MQNNVPSGVKGKKHNFWRQTSTDPLKFAFLLTFVLPHRKKNPMQ